MQSRLLTALKRAPVVLAAPLWLPFYILSLVCEFHFLPSEWRLLGRMRAAGRYLPTESVASRTGTIIVDYPTFNWGISRVWWTPDDVHAAAPTPPPTEAEEDTDEAREYVWHPFHRWVTERYLDEERGTAILLGVWHSGRRLERLRERFPQCQLVSSFSGGRDLERFMRGLRQAPDC